MLEILLLLAAACTAGALNAVAGGGSFLTLPALVFSGVPPVMANATGTVALFPGYIASAWGFREDLAPPPGLTLRAVMGLSLVGGALGALLLLATPDATFRRVVPWLLLAATALFALGACRTLGVDSENAPQRGQFLPDSPPHSGTMGQEDGKKWAAAAHSQPTAPKSDWLLGPRLRPAARPDATAHAVTPAARLRAQAGVLAVAAYGGYFNGGLGILLLALFGLLGQTRLHAANGLKNLVSALLTAIAVLIYAAGGLVAWPQALAMMLAATAGGYGGARLARRIPAPWLRAGIVATGLVMAGLFFWRG
ncbi:sulfite exporter TauE/SafE family protein [Extensimonas sp. H3M7-6]|uniref:sulfite exporter TauE/SafE family protein n=1 Tax=Extensimonas soli TaxID=3031322 RepID=UPI0023D9F86E|nr:sulfite exporter TauE/SafE family protein [Extensimonas sp. H3M7-6]MDF1481359.1 sulfite exporter TauE/SafE family protein [Extensimonas sp. H3M7-6]